MRVKIIKRSIILFLAVYFCIVVGDTSKVIGTDITTSTGITMTAEEYDHLRNLGFSDLAIEVMEREVFEENINFELDSQSVVTKYYEIKEQPELDVLLKQNSISTNEEDTNYIQTELTEDEYFKRVEANKEQLNSKSEINPASSDQTRTSYRRLITRIQRSGSTIRLHSSFIWDTMPKTRSYDVMSISIDSMFSPKSGSQYGQQFWTTYNPNVRGPANYGSSNYSSSSSLWRKQSAGYGVRMNLRDDYSNARVTNLEGYIYYNIVRNSSVKPRYINAYGNYSHAKKSISSSFSYNLSFGGPGISWQGISRTSFDTITTHAQTKY